MEGFKNRRISQFIADESSGVSPAPETIKKTLQAAALGAGVIAGANIAGSSHVEAGGARIEIQKQALDERELDFLAENVYHEARGESLRGQLAVAQVTLARLISGKFGKTLPSVIFAQNQFSWTKDPHILMTRMDDAAFENLKARIAFVIGGKSLHTAVAMLAKEIGLPHNTYYYKRTDWDERDPDEARMSEKTKLMFKKLKKVGEIDSHTFYTD